MGRAIAAALALVALTGGESAAVAATPRPALKLSAARGLPGLRLTVRAGHLRPRARAAVSFGGRRVRTVRAGRRGSLRTAIRIPARKPGLYTVKVRTGKRAAAKRFRILAAPLKPQAPAPGPQAQQSVAPEQPATLVAAGDIACKVGDPVVTSPPGTCHHGAVSDLVLSLNPDVVAPLGDNQYETGSEADFTGSYDPTWGRFKGLTRPVVGNHEYTSSADHTTATPYYTYFGAPAGEPAKGYYSYHIGNWTGVVLNSGDIAWTKRMDNTLPDDCFPVSCKAGQPQEQWLRELLQSLPPSRCVVAFMHHPRYSSGNAGISDNAELRDIYKALYDNGVDLVLNGHVHTYERFPPMDADGHADPQGVPDITVGTGGRSRAGTPTSSPLRSAFYLPRADGFGVLELKLFDGRYDYRFVTESGAVPDQGAGSCHGPAQP